MITKPLAEEMAAGALLSRGWRVYLPRYRRILRGHRRGARGEVVMRPLFPRYLFVEQQERWSGVASVPGVVALVGGMQDGYWAPYWVSAAVVELIRGSERGGAFDEVRGDGVRQDLREGDKVSVPMWGSDLIGKLIGLDEDGRARVLIEILGRGVTAQVDAAGLVAMEG